jgi:hypothetical protein
MRREETGSLESKPETTPPNLFLKKRKKKKKKKNNISNPGLNSGVPAFFLSFLSFCQAQPV